MVELLDRLRLIEEKLNELLSLQAASATEATAWNVISEWLNKKCLAMGIEWRTHSIRLAYASRLCQCGGSELDVMIATRLMGHSVEGHLETYRSHIDPNQIAVTARAAIS